VSAYIDIDHDGSYVEHPYQSSKICAVIEDACNNGQRTVLADDCSSLPLDFGCQDEPFDNDGDDNGGDDDNGGGCGYDLNCDDKISEAECMSCGGTWTGATGGYGACVGCGDDDDGSGSGGGDNSGGGDDDSGGSGDGEDDNNQDGEEDGEGEGNCGGPDQPPCDITGQCGGPAQPPCEIKDNTTVSGGLGCDRPPRCTGSQVQCAILYQQWQTRCQSDLEEPQQNEINQRIDEQFTEPLPEKILDVGDFTTAFEALPPCTVPNLDVQIMGKNITFETNLMCPFLTLSAFFLNVITAIAGVKLVLKGLN
jgi:hypothetical protein